MGRLVFLLTLVIEMENQYVPLDVAEDLRTLGFEEDSMGYWQQDKLVIHTPNNYNKIGLLSAPLYRQVIHWLLNKWRGYIIRDSCVRSHTEVRYGHRMGKPSLPYHYTRTVCDSTIKDTIEINTK